MDLVKCAPFIQIPLVNMSADLEEYKWSSARNLVRKVSVADEYIGLNFCLRKLGNVSTAHPMVLRVHFHQ